jgi:hypothetical protein
MSLRSDVLASDGRVMRSGIKGFGIYLSRAIYGRY